MGPQMEKLEKDMEEQFKILDDMNQWVTHILVTVDFESVSWYLCNAASAELSLSYLAVCLFPLPCQLSIRISSEL